MAKSQYESKLFDRILKNSAKVKHEITECQFGSVESYTLYKDCSDCSLEFTVNMFHGADTKFSGWIWWNHPEWGLCCLFDSLDTGDMHETLSDLMVDAVAAVAKKCEGYTIWDRAEDALKWLAMS